MDNTARMVDHFGVWHLSLEDHRKADSTTDKAYGTRFWMGV